jgi:hypothetical protein
MTHIWGPGEHPLSVLCGHNPPTGPGHHAIAFESATDEERPGPAGADTRCAGCWDVWRRRKASMAEMITICESLLDYIEAEPDWKGEEKAEEAQAVINRARNLLAKAKEA